MNDISTPELNETPHSGQPIRSIQYMLNELAIHDPRLIRLAVDGVFGERTLEAVMVFQREFHPPVTGVVDLSTWDAIQDAYFQMQLLYGAPPPLNVLPNGAFTSAQGDESEPMLIVQAMFVSLSRVMTNFQPCQVNGRNEGKTHTNIRTVQQLSGLPITGILDRSTWAYLVQLYQALVTRG